MRPCARVGVEHSGMLIRAASLLMVGCQNTSMKPERATRNLCRKERFLIHGLTRGRDPNPGFRVLREQRNSQPAEVSQFSKNKKKPPATHPKDPKTGHV